MSTEAWCTVSVSIQVCVCCTCQSEEAPPVSAAHVRRVCWGEASSTRAWTVMLTFTRPFSSRMWWGRHSLSWETRVRAERNRTERGERKERDGVEEEMWRQKRDKGSTGFRHNAYNCNACFCLHECCLKSGQTRTYCFQEIATAPHSHFLPPTRLLYIIKYTVYYLISVKVCKYHQ